MNTVTTTNNLTAGKLCFVPRLVSSRRFSGLLVALLFCGVAQGQALGQQPIMVIANGLVPIFDGDTLDFGEVSVGGSPSSHALTIRNVGVGVLTLGSPFINGLAASDYQVNQLPAQIQPGSFAVLGISFTASQPGNRIALITIPNNTVGIPDFTIILEGIGLSAPSLSVADGLVAIEDGDTLQLDEVELGQSTGKALVIRNVGGDTLEFTAPQHVLVQGADAADFEVTLAVAEIAPAGFAVLTINFTPSQVGLSVATIRIPNNDPTQSDYSFIVAGNATEALVAELELVWENVALVNGDTLDFGQVIVEKTLETTLEVLSDGGEILAISAFEFSGEAAADYTIDVANAELSNGVTLTTTLAVTPSAAGPRTATLTIVNNSVDGNIVLELTTEGIFDCNENGISDTEDLLNGGEDCNSNQVLDVCETDTDNDGVIDVCDNCMDTPNADQLDTDADGTGDACELEDNNDEQDEDDEELEDEIEDVDDDVVVEDQNEDEDVIDDNDDLEENRDVNDDLQDHEVPFPSDNFCGVGVAGMIPAMMFGLCGMRPRRRS